MNSLQTPSPLAILPAEGPAQVSLLASLADEIWHECFSEMLTVEQIDYMVEKYLSEAAIKAQAREEGTLYYLLEMGGEAGGFLALQPRDGRMLLSKIYLRRDHRGQGYAATALAFAEDTGRAHACRDIWLTVNRRNARACAAYEKAGYRRAGTRVADIGGGFVMDDYLYEKPL